MMYFFTYQRTKENKAGGWVQADSVDEALLKLEKELKVKISEIDLSFEMTDTEWQTDMTRPFQGD